MAPTSVSTMSRRLIRRPANSSEMRVSVAPAAFPIPRARCRPCAHRDDEIPARRGLSVDHQVLDDLNAVVAGRLEPEGVDVGRQVQVVVDGLRDVDDPDAPPDLLLELRGRIGGVIAADRDELPHVEPEERENGVLEMCGIAGGVAPRDADVRPASEMDPADALDGQAYDMVDVPLHEPLKAVRTPTTSTPSSSDRDGRRADDAVDARGGTARDQNGQLLALAHDRYLPGSRGRRNTSSLV